MSDKSDIIKYCTKAFLGDYTSIIDILNEIKEMCTSISDKIFYKKFESLMLGLESKGTDSEYIRKKLSNSSYSNDYAEVLLNYINKFESSEKSEYMVNLLDSVCHDYITPDECMMFCWYLTKISLLSINYLKRNINKITIHGNVDSKTDMNVIELLNNGLMYDSENNGISFNEQAFLFDKYCLSYLDESKYKNYDNKMSGIPKEFPDAPHNLVFASPKNIK